MEEQERLLSALAGRTTAQARGERLPFRIGSQELCLDALAGQQLLEEPGTRCLVAGRVGGVNAKVLEERVFRFTIERIGIATGGTATLHGNREDQNRGKDDRAARNHAARKSIREPLTSGRIPRGTRGKRPVNR